MKKTVNSENPIHEIVPGPDECLWCLELIDRTKYPSHRIRTHEGECREKNNLYQHRKRTMEAYVRRAFPRLQALGRNYKLDLHMLYEPVGDDLSLYPSKDMITVLFYGFRNMKKIRRQKRLAILREQFKKDFPNYESKQMKAAVKKALAEMELNDPTGLG